MRDRRGFTLVELMIVVAIVAVIKIISDNRIKKMLIERGKVDENIKFLYQNKSLSDPLSSVKWGLVLIGFGVALLLAQLFPYTVTDEAMIGLMFLFAGFGFLVYYFMAKSQSDKL